MDPFSILVSNLQQLGFYGFILPFIFMFAVCFGLLTKHEVIGENKNIIGVVSLVIAFFVTGYGAVPLGEVLSNLFGAAAVVLAGVLVVVLLAHMAGYNLDVFTDKKYALAVLVIVGIALFIASGALAIFNINFLGNDTLIAAVFMIALVIIAVWFIGNSDD